MKLTIFFIKIGALIFLTSCASRGWQLSEQIEGVDNRLKKISNQQKNMLTKSYVDRGLASQTFNKKKFSKSKIDFNGNFTPTSFNEPGLLLISR